MKKIDYLNKIYEKNPETGNYIIEISLDKYTDIFNEWDHASYKKRDMDPQLAMFLEDCSEEIPQQYGIDICFYLPKELKNVDKEKIIASGIKTYYSFYSHYQMRHLKFSYTKVVSYIAISFMFLAMAFLLGEKKPDLLSNTIIQGMTVGGWVFLWEAISFFFFRQSEQIGEINNYKRLSSAVIFFKYDSQLRISK